MPVRKAFVSHALKKIKSFQITCVFVIVIILMDVRIAKGGFVFLAHKLRTL
jgi:hypothetical protein